MGEGNAFGSIGFRVGETGGVGELPVPGGGRTVVGEVGEDGGVVEIGEAGFVKI